MKVGLVATTFAAAIACSGASVPHPPYGRHTTAALVEVPYPPPPARVETIPKAPQDDAVWVDGEWVWQTRRWAWKPGRWVVAPRGLTFTPWTTVRDARGSLYAASGAWHDASGREVEEPTLLAAARSRPGTVVTPEGDAVPGGPTLPVDAGTTKPVDAGEPLVSPFDDAGATLLPDGGTLETAP